MANSNVVYRAVYTVILGAFCHVAHAQDASIPDNGTLYRPRNANIVFAYDSATQHINLSGNWDFDGDQKKDSLFLIGNGGAHLYFHPKCVTSSNHKVYEFFWINTDIPILSEASELLYSKNDNPLYPTLVVHDFDNDGVADVYMNFDSTFCPIPGKWRQKGIRTRRVVLYFGKQSCTITNYHNP